MYKTISNKIIRTIKPSYDPSKYITDENEELPIKEWIEKYRSLIPTDDIMRLLCRKEFLSKKDLRLFAVWCAREALKLVEKPDKRSVEACDVSERYANGQATKEELNDAYNAAYAAATAAIYYATFAKFATPNYYATKAAYYAAAAHTSAISAAHASALSARDTVSRAAADDAARAAAYATSSAVYDAARSSQLDKLLTYFE
jgi:hypothetical protein